MKLHRMLSMLTAAWALICTSQDSGAEDMPEGTGWIDYFGYADCIELVNEKVRVVLGLHGGRVLEYSWKGENAIYLNPDHEGWIYDPDKPQIDPSGGRFDIGPELVLPPHPDLWVGKWEGEILGPRRAQMVSVKDKATGTQLVRVFELDAESSHLSCTQLIKNISAETIERNHWSRTFGQGKGICLVPLGNHFNRFPRKYIVFGPGPIINYEPEDPNIRVRDNFLEIVDTPIEPWIAVDSYVGWFGYLMRNDLLFVKRFPTFPEKMYPDIGAYTVVLWYFEDEMCELEPFGPKEILDPGEAASFTEDWWLLPYDFPHDGGDVDLAKVQQIVDKYAR